MVYIKAYNAFNDSKRKIMKYTLVFKKFYTNKFYKIDSPITKKLEQALKIYLDNLSLTYLKTNYCQGNMQHVLKYKINVFTYIFIIFLLIYYLEFIYRA